MMEPITIWGPQLSRAARDKAAIQKLTNDIVALEPETYIDLACGNGDLILSVGRLDITIQCSGVDLSAYPEWNTKSHNVFFVQTSMQEYIEGKKEAVDVVSLIETFRYWPEGTEHVRTMLLNWVRRYVKYFVVGCEMAQEEMLRNIGKLEELGHINGRPVVKVEVGK